MALLQERQCRRAVLHAFDGKAHYAQAAAAAGYYLSVPPCARRSPLMQKWIKRVPLDRLLLETDAPALVRACVHALPPSWYPLKAASDGCAVGVRRPSCSGPLSHPSC